MERTGDPEVYTASRLDILKARRRELTEHLDRIEDEIQAIEIAIRIEEHT